jgi:hypothetical protein
MFKNVTKIQNALDLVAKLIQALQMVHSTVSHLVTTFGPGVVKDPAPTTAVELQAAEPAA